MAPRSVLILDDDLSLLRVLQSGLQPLFRVHIANGHEAARRIVTGVPIDLCVVNYSIEKVSGFEFIRDVKACRPGVPCVLMTAREDEPVDEVVQGVVAKPFTADELRNCLLRVLASRDGELAELVLDGDRHSVLVDGRTVLLTPIEFRILSELWRARGTLVRREDICAKLWGTTRVTDHTFDTHFTNMKRKIPELRDRITLVRSQGYIFTP
jgi:DNA-binding response OmpR family regulator